MWEHDIDNHWTASALEKWYLFYAVPCLNGILPQSHFDNVCLHVNGIFILLGDSILNLDLDVAWKDYHSFESVYGTSNTQVNLHNMVFV